MEFHLNGFRPGDPVIADAEAALPAPARPRRLPPDVDVLIVGCGSTGLTLAAQLAVFATISVRHRPQGRPLRLGQADGIACRSLDDVQRLRVRRQGDEGGLVGQQDSVLEAGPDGPGGLTPDYSRRLIELDRPADPAVPITACFERTDDAHAGALETIRARYVVGCDGARSTVRRAIGRPLTGDTANQAWGVMDVLAVTDFPDIRFKCLVYSANGGNMVIIPRVFIAGDACHSHSPKAGQRMNVSMRDGDNLGWKLAAVLTGRAKPELLHSYSSERRAVANELIDFDRELARMSSARPRTSDDEDGVDPTEFQRYFQQHLGGEVPPLLRPTKGRYGLIDYHKVFCPDLMAFRWGERLSE